MRKLLIAAPMRRAAFRPDADTGYLRECFGAKSLPKHMRRMSLLIALAVCLLIASSAWSEEMKTPPGCVPASGAKPGYGGYADKIVHSKTRIDLILVPPGTYQMGSAPGEEAAAAYPIHKVTIAYAFYIGRTEVTNGQFKPFTDPSVGYDGFKDVDPAYDLWIKHFRGKSIMPTGDNFPMVWVSWKNAKAFCDWAGGLDLPSESEWEYACRAGTTTPYYWGTDLKLADKYAWTLQNSKRKTNPVAQLEPNAWGLYDMAGNVWEWTLDDYDEYTNTPRDGSALNSGLMTKVLRGGGWGSGAQPYSVSSNGRYFSAPTNASNDCGFRVVIRLKQP